jgi:hypothetical protein
MDLDTLAQSAVDTLVEHLLNAGGQVLSVPVDRLFRLLEGRVGATGVLRAATEHAQSPVLRRTAHQTVADAMRADTTFAQQVAAALHAVPPAVQVYQQSAAYAPGGSVYQGGVGQQGGIAVTSGGPVRFDGPVAGRDVNVDRSKRFHIGSIRFGTGGLVALILAGTVSAGGVAVGVVAATQAGGSAAVSAATGRWVHGSGVSMSCMKEDDTTLVINPDATFRAHVGLSFTNDNCGGSSGFGPPAGFTGPQIDCSGTVSTDGPNLVFKSSVGPCATFTAQLHDGTLELADGTTFVRQ